MKDVVKFVVVLTTLFILARTFWPTTSTVAPPAAEATLAPPSAIDQVMADHKRALQNAIAAVVAAGNDSHRIATILDLHYRATQRTMAEVEYGGSISIGEQARLLNILKSFDLPYEYELQEARSRRSLTDRDRAKVGYAALLASR